MLVKGGEEGIEVALGRNVADLVVDDGLWRGERHGVLKVQIGLGVEGEGLHAILPVPAVDGGHDGPRPPELRRKHVEEAIEVGGEP